MVPLSESHPHLVNEWSPKNALSPAMVRAGSSAKVVWICERGHEWTVSPNSRTSNKGTGCPFCANRKVWPGFNDLASQRPDIAAQWHHYKNGDRSPHDVLACSNSYAWWRCPRDGYEWRSRIRTRSRPACPLCSGKVTVSGANDVVTRFPAVAAQWHPTKNLPVDPSSVGGSSPKKFWWRCDLGHEWSASVRNRTYAKSGCPFCSGTTVLVGFNDFASQFPTVAAQWHPTRNDLSPTEVVPGSQRKIWWQCTFDGYEWTATPSSRTQVGGAQCPVCANQIVIAGHNDIFTTHPSARHEWSIDNVIDPQTISAGSNRRVKWRCPKDGHEWSATPNGRFGRAKQSGCARCCGRIPTPGVTDLRTTHPHLADELADGQPHTAESLSAGSGEVEWKCPVDGYRWKASVHARTSRGQGCPVCANKAVLEGVNDLTTTHPHLAEQWSSTNERRATQVVAGSKYSAEWICPEEHVWKAAISNRTFRKSGCPKCWAQQIDSTGQREVAHFVESLADGAWTVQRNVRGLLNTPKAEVDIYLPELRTAVEFNGVYYHSSAFRKPDYHLKKHRMCTQAGIELIQIWEDDWILRRGPVESMLRAKLDRPAAPPIPARLASAAVSDRTVVSDFLDSNHIEGSAPGDWFGCLKAPDGGLVAAMVLRDCGKASVEVARYATSHAVSGGFTKLLTFIASRLPAHINAVVAFADLETSDGSLYRDAGFVAAGELAPDYTYVLPGGNTRHAKSLFGKARFRADPRLKFDEALTAEQLADLNGLFRCYDSGKHRFVKRPNR
jgi:hypothetical protein